MRPQEAASTRNRVGMDALRRRRAGRRLLEGKLACLRFCVRWSRPRWGDCASNGQGEHGLDQVKVTGRSGDGGIDGTGALRENLLPSVRSHLTPSRRGPHPPSRPRRGRRGRFPWRTEPAAERDQVKRRRDEARCRPYRYQDRGSMNALSRFDHLPAHGCPRKPNRLHTPPRIRAWTQAQPCRGEGRHSQPPSASPSMA